LSTAVMGPKCLLSPLTSRSVAMFPLGSRQAAGTAA
jgi:hypothetical protein